MNTKWVILLTTILALALSGQVTFDVQPSAPGSTRHAVWQEVTPYPSDTDASPGTVEAEAPAATSEGDGLPRPPSESGQNMILIVGAILLVLIIFLGVAANSRKIDRDG
ncbi:MAG: hypothetical protein ACOYYS_02295 [Chloroflexota bacterium]